MKTMFFFVAVLFFFSFLSVDTFPEMGTVFDRPRPVTENETKRL